ncbi:MAG: quinone-dependent dihydroorotate dehydrogenase [Saprospiraceae bacterium]|jgi:dihydroorotate dehydrogenase|nr:quinone-dependent dihydroorotate dehydrogenase [Saprospiraceae bacterium]MBK7437481.1 quinone-dependent dihydroorotate dehydrogenase [Saprospiraceae bacterium]MBK9678616.1 quinone-dependent dihydroorotate dehydrogenase [Saprospiraceae bacterium]
MWQYIIKPLLFLLNPERAHHLTLGLFKIMCRIPGVSAIIKSIFNPNYKGDPIQLFGLTFHHPVGLAAGLDKDGQYIKELALLGFSHIEIGTVTPRPQDGNPRPRLFRLPKDQALINRMGFNNEGAAAMAQRLKALPKIPKLILGINIGKNKDTPLELAHEDYLSCFETLYPYADYFTINISSPNTPGLRGLQEKEPLIKLLSAIRVANSKKAIPRPVLVKIAPDLDDLQLAEIKNIIIEQCMDGLIMGNTTLDRSNLNTSSAILDQIGPGGLSGLPVFEKSNNRLSALSALPGAIPLVGVGGILDSKSAQEKLSRGASLVQVYTGFIFTGPGIVKKICNAF